MLLPKRGGRADEYLFHKEQGVPISQTTYFISSSSAMRTPSLSGFAFFATMSMATLARYRFVPMPAVAVMPVLYTE